MRGPIKLFSTRLVGLQAITVAILIAGGPQAQAADTSAPNAGVLAVVQANPSAVHDAGQIPPRWNLLLDGSGNASLVVFMYFGDVTIAGVTHPYQWVALGAILDSSRLPPGIHSTSDVLGLPQNVYMIHLSSSSSDLARYLKDAGFGPGSEYVAGLKFNLGSDPAPAFQFAAPRSDPSPFSFSAQLTPAFFPTLPDTVDWWRDTPTGTAEMETNDNHELVGGYLNWTLTTDPSTPLAEMMGTTTQTRTCSTNVADPFLGIAAGQVRTGCIMREAFSSTSLRTAFIPSRPSASETPTQTAPKTAAGSHTPGTSGRPVRRHHPRRLRGSRYRHRARNHPHHRRATFARSRQVRVP